MSLCILKYGYENYVSIVCYMCLMKMCLKWNMLRNEMSFIGNEKVKYVICENVYKRWGSGS
jgi:hypothetical protein